MRSSLAVVAVLLGTAFAHADETFEKEVRPLLVPHCLDCRSPKKARGGLRPDTRAGWQKDGDGGPAIKLGKPDDSLIIKAVHGKDGLKRIPPKDQLTVREIAALIRWIKDGAIHPRDGGPVKLGGTTVEAAKKWWAFRQLVEVARPEVKDRDLGRTPIDAFVLKKLEDAGLRPAPEADAATLLRRVYFDLTSLPPSPAEQEAFLLDPTPRADERVVDRLLASPAFGERWGRHWLDVARYAESLGFEHDEVRAWFWRYRDWVIDAFIADMPYDRFLTEQLASDEVKDADARSQIATSFLRLGTYESNAADHRNARYAHLDDLVSTVSMAFLGLNLQCARCHDHTFEPILQEDYYRTLAIFEPLDTVDYRLTDVGGEVVKKILA